MPDRTDRLASHARRGRPSPARAETGRRRLDGVRVGTWLAIVILSLAVWIGLAAAIVALVR